jgi:hypothetical protein
VRSRDRWVKRGNGAYWHKGRILKQRMGREGYILSQTTIDGKHVNFSVHRLVAKGFRRNPHNLPEVNHIDGNKRNNLPSNLEWIDKSNNMIHAYRVGLKLPTSNEQKRKAACEGNEQLAALAAAIGF